MGVAYLAGEVISACKLRWCVPFFHPIFSSKGGAGPPGTLGSCIAHREPIGSPSDKL